jgi:pSer/pThr/pTyr-binding forkhead associated (FHA) protein
LKAVIANPKRKSTMAVLVLLHEDVMIDKYAIDTQGLVIGRSLECDIFIDDNLVSKKHAQIEVVERLPSGSGREYFIIDLNSTNHTYLNGEEVTRGKLNGNDLVRVGRHTFKFIDESTAQSDKTAKLRKSWIPGVYYTKE